MTNAIAGFNALSSTTNFTINSLTFLAFGILSVLVLRVARFKSYEPFVLFIFNTIFLSFIMGGIQNVVFLFSFLLFIYFLASISWKLKKQISIFRLSSVVILWAILFLVKDHLLFEKYNPFSHLIINILGISYITFRGISYIMESHLLKKRSFLDFYNYIVFFPTLISGPIERFIHFNTNNKVTDISDENDFWVNLNRVLNGCIKKFVLADNLMSFSIFSLGHETQSSLLLLWFGALNVLFLIYLDFSGYCDIMIGLARLMGYKLSENFNRPFVSVNIQEFWTRWHMSLGSIIQDYVFTPINKYVILNVRRSFQAFWISATYLLSMILVAMWHGTTLGFILFGFLHGAVLIVFQLKRTYIKKLRSLRFFTQISNHPTAATVLTYSSAALTYSFVSISLILWYSSFPHAILTFRKLLGM